MDPHGSEALEGSDEKPEEQDQDPTPNIPLRQRRLPASFWQEPCLAPSPPIREVNHSSVLQPTVHQFPIASLHPWTMNSNNTTLPVFLPHRLVTPSHLFSIQQSPNPSWMRGSTNCCSCSTCLSYSYVIPRSPDVYSGLRYRPVMNVPCCPMMNCVDQSCKLCSTSDRWHPDRLRHFRLRAARYNAILD